MRPERVGLEPIAGQPRSDGYVRYSDPVLTPGPAVAPEPLRAGLVLAQATTRITEQAWRTATALTLPAPFAATLPPGSPFIGTADAAGHVRPCLTHAPDEPFSPLEDEAGDIYPGLCLVDEDGDGAYDQALVLPYLEGRKERVVPIAGTRLAAVVPGPQDKEFSFGLTTRREIVVEEVSRSDARLALRESLRVDREAEAPADIIVDRVRVTLRAGDHAVLGGVGLTVRGGSGRWMIDSDGVVAPWVSLTTDGIAIGRRVLPYPER